ncbi:hypothetical protein OPW07_22400 [Vibrio europaeus]|uniref:Outer membrane protein beta-barrel domain-containing protein n=1 Tax=Vibrio europaeus TaxID=300876 RepID=A0AAE7AZS5_9VIBR|nr:hypothetical protein [Vibrio europaeus]MDC5812481.1 hypothetical protein [Vibrio europaeus]QJY38885.1 hypothetical protein HOO69_20220 [Vibrio europaeus]QPG33907.1 hypothetical protein IXK98_07240 [Vibrio europaeus]
MKKLLLSTCVVLTVISPQVFAETDFTPSKDKLYHLSGSALLGFGTNYVLKDWRHAFGTCVTIGLAKEIYDEVDYGGGSTADMAYNIIGCGIGVGVGESLGVKMAFVPERNLDGFMIAVRYDF